MKRKDWIPFPRVERGNIRRKKVLGGRQKSEIKERKERKKKRKKYKRNKKK